LSTGAPKLYGPPWTGCTFYRPDENGPWLCSSHKQGAQACAKFYLGQLEIATDLLIERARQAEELIARLEKIEVHKDRLMDGLATIHDHAMHTHDADWSRYFEFAERTIGVVGSDEIALFRARAKVVEAAQRAHRATQVANGVDIDEAQREADVAWGQVADAVQALEKLEGKL
jgi:hypothetical protein